MNITYVILSLAGGGAERVLSLISQEAVKKGHQVTIYTCLPICDYSISSEITVVNAFSKKELNHSLVSKIKYKSLFIIRLYKFLKINRPDVVVSFMKGINKQSIIVSKLLNLPVIVSEHTNYKKMNFIEWLERRFLYKMADALTVLTKSDYNDYYRHFLPRAVVMPNPCSFIPVKKINERGNSLIAVGSLDRWEIKGFDNLFTIFSKFVNIYPDWTLKVAGTGDSGLNYLESLARKLNITNNVIFLGFCSNLDEELHNSSIFVLSSRYEGFPMALVEAMSQGCACVSFDCTSGPREIINNGVDGVLVEDQNLSDLEAALSVMIEDKEKRLQLASNAIKNIERFSLNTIGNEWDALLLDTLEAHSK